MPSNISTAAACLLALLAAILGAVFGGGVIFAWSLSARFDAVERDQAEAVQSLHREVRVLTIQMQDLATALTRQTDERDQRRGAVQRDNLLPRDTQQAPGAARDVDIGGSE